VTRLPVPGSDNGQWGDILNTFLLTAHNSDGTLKSGAVGGGTLANNSVSASKLAVPSGQDGQVLTKDSGQAGGLSWTSVSQSQPLAKNMLTGVILEQNGVYPARPTGFANVKFIGVNDPGSAAQDGDEWVKL
jgi:hypothetical protein